jgi:Tetracyclin repressor-like, C-terminal domain
VQAILDCQAEGTAPSGDPQPLVLTAWSLMHGLATLYVDGTLPKVKLDAGQLSPLVASLASQMFAALAAEQSRPPKRSPKAGARRHAD